jgi:hypothetical protein
MSFSKPAPKGNTEIFNFASLLQNVGNQRGNAEVNEARAQCLQNFNNMSPAQKQQFVQLLIQSGFTYSWNPDRVDEVIEENESLAATRGFEGTGPLVRARGGKESWKELMSILWRGVNPIYWSVGNFYVANLAFCTELGDYFYATGGVAFNGVVSHSRFWFRCLQWNQVQTILDMQIDACIFVLENISYENIKGPHQKVTNPYREWNINFSVIPMLTGAEALDAEVTKINVFNYLLGKGKLNGNDQIMIANINKPSVYLTNATVAKNGKVIKTEYVDFVVSRFEKLRVAFNKTIKINGGPLEPEYSYDSKAGLAAAYSYITSYVQFFVAQVRAAVNGGGQQLKNEPRAFHSHMVAGKALFVPERRGSRGNFQTVSSGSTSSAFGSGRSQKPMFSNTRAGVSTDSIAIMQRMQNK